MTDRTNAEMTILAATVQNENNLINQRLIWGLTLQGFLFASYFFVGSEQAERVKFALPLLGAAIALSSFLGTFFAHMALLGAMKTFARLQRELGGADDVKPGLRFPFLFTLLSPHFFIPIALLATWAFVYSQNHMPLAG